MRDLVYIKFNSMLRQKKANKDKDPLEKPIVDALEDEDNEWITGLEPTEVDPKNDGETGAGGSSQGTAAAPQREETRRGGSRNKKRKRLIPSSLEDEEQSAPSSDGEEDTAMHPYFSSDLRSNSEGQHSD